ncbi:ERF family protein [Streptococcus porcinus]|uniref:ERF family protein n=1 Tax=Streptococcus porcinus TaxID=1340 RepID=A0A7V9WT56_STRPO|nr:ERF family protein [Streptococcus porcinus]MBA2796582.1 ERF family protein [Streptococcus porcinus]
MTMTFSELQTKMQISKTTKQGVKYTFRNAEDIFTHFKTLNSGWELTVSDELVELIGRIFIKATATAKNGDEVHDATRYAELDSVPVLNTKDYKTGEPKQVQQMQVPQWTGAVSSYAGKYALQGLFGIGEEDVDALATGEQTVKKQQDKPATKKSSPKINDEIVKAYKDGIQQVITLTGKNDGSIMKWFLNNLNVTMIENITLDQTAKADKLLEQLLKGANK